MCYFRKTVFEVIMLLIQLLCYIQYAREKYPYKFIVYFWATIISTAWCIMYLSFVHKILFILQFYLFVADHVHLFHRTCTDVYSLTPSDKRPSVIQLLEICIVVFLYCCVNNTCHVYNRYIVFAGDLYNSKSSKRLSMLILFSSA